jgi:hypothetical protein
VRRLSADADAGWSEPSRMPILDGSGSIIAFASRRPIDDDDRGDDYDLFVQRRCIATAQRQLTPRYGRPAASSERSGVSRHKRQGQIGRDSAVAWARVLLDRLPPSVIALDRWLLSVKKVPMCMD